MPPAGQPMQLVVRSIALWRLLLEVGRSWAWPWSGWLFWTYPCGFWFSDTFILFLMKITSLSSPRPCWPLVWVLRLRHSLPESVVVFSPREPTSEPTWWEKSSQIFRRMTPEIRPLLLIMLVIMLAMWPAWVLTFMNLMPGQFWPPPLLVLQLFSDREICSSKRSLLPWPLRVLGQFFLFSVFLWSELEKEPVKKICWEPWAVGLTPAPF